MENCKYKFQYINNDYKAEVTFNAEITLDTLQEKLEYFLLACSWTPEQIDSLFGALEDE